MMMTRMMKSLIAGGAGLAAIAAAAPAAAQWGSPYYGGGYGYGYNNNATQYAAQRCSAEVQRRLSYGTRGAGAGILGAILGVGVQSRGQVLNVTRVEPRRNSVRVRGLATSGRYAGYGNYGYGAYGAAGYGYQPDLTFRCDVDYRGYVRDVDIYRR
jgi:hypothetical protein